MSPDIDYDSIEVPEDTSPQDYHYTARRAEILQFIRDAGHPGALTQTHLADRYGCSAPNIHKDLNVLADYVDSTLGTRRVLIAEAVYQKSIRELQDEGEWRKAAQTVNDWNDWVEGREDVQELREEIDDLRSIIEGGADGE